MKSSSIYTLSIVFLAIGISACGKTTKRKLVNDWKVTSYYEETKLENPDGDKITNTTSMTETVATMSMVFEPNTGVGSSNSRTGSVNTNEFSIQKDGTWSLIRETTYPSGNSSYNYKVEQSGTWSFLKKTKGDDFEKNERVHFNVLSSKKLETDVMGQTVVNTSSDEETFLTGENVLVYSIKESKKDELEMELEKKYTVSQDPGNDFSNSTIQKMTLKGK